MLLQCLEIRPHLSSLTNVENSINNFCQSVQTWCRKEEREENNGNCKTFCVTRKRNKIITLKTNLYILKKTKVSKINIVIIS